MAKALKLGEVVTGPLARSRRDRRRMRRRFRCIPRSILKLHRKDGMTVLQYQDETGLARYALGSSPSLQRYAAADPSWKSTVGHVQSRGAKPGKAASVMPSVLVEFAVKYYAEPGQLYCDPFAGHGVRLQVAHALGLHYVGYDVCQDYLRFCRAVIGRLQPTELRLEVRDQDARTIGREVRGWQFCFTSPPYWCVEKYDDDPRQLTRLTYQEFLASMAQVWRAMRAQAAPRAWLVVNVGDFRYKGRFYPFHADILRTMADAGFDPWDVAILPDTLLGGTNTLFSVPQNKHRILPRVHEYLLVGRLPQ